MQAGGFPGLVVCKTLESTSLKETAIHINS
jgi:hypothetical protein